MYQLNTIRNLNLNTPSFVEYRKMTNKGVSFQSSSDAFNLNSSYSKNNLILRQEFEKILKKQGAIGKTWDKVKVLFKIKNSSSSVIKILENNKNGLVSDKDTSLAIERYYTSQKKGLDFIADIASSTAGLGIFTLAMTAFNAPLSVGLLSAILLGSLSKCAVKIIDSKTADREYKSLAYDIATGGINGFLSPIVSGISNGVLKNSANILKINSSNKTFLLKGVQELNSPFAEFIFCPKQKLETGFCKKTILYFLSQTAKKLSKIALAFGLRNIAFNANYKNPIIYGAVLASADNKEEVKNKFDETRIDYSNEM